MDFDATLKRAFAEAPEPADDHFVHAVSWRVAKREKAAAALAWGQVVGITVGAMAAAFCLLTMLVPMAPSLMASFGLELAQAHGSMVSASSFNLSAVSAAGLTQMLIVFGAIAGGAALVRVNQQQQ